MFKAERRTALHRPQNHVPLPLRSLSNAKHQMKDGGEKTQKKIVFEHNL